MTRRTQIRLYLFFFLLFLAAVLLAAQSGRSYGPGRIWWEAGRGTVFPLEEDYDDPDGEVGILNVQGAVKPGGHAFFEALGSNGRACITCHQPSNAMGLSTALVRQRWAETNGLDPIFAAIDGSNCPSLPQNLASSHSLLLNRGLIRIFLPWPPKSATGATIKPQFRIEVVRDPSGCNTSPLYGLSNVHPTISVYRRPRVVANFKFVSHPVLMADGREPSLSSQAMTAALVHEQAQLHPTPEQLKQIVDFEMQIFAAQSSDIRGGLLNEKGGPSAGAENLAIGNELSLSSFDAWRKPADARHLGLQVEFRSSVARGSSLFEERCASCHTAAASRAADVGTTNLPSAMESPDLPLFRVTCDGSGRVIYTQDPGRALITGKCADVGAIVTQQLHGLVARPPYFSNGSAATLGDVVDFYDRRFSIGYSQREKQDLVNFLRSL